MLGPCAPPGHIDSQLAREGPAPLEKFILTGLGPALHASRAARFPNPDSVGL